MKDNRPKKRVAKPHVGQAAKDTKKQLRIREDIRRDVDKRLAEWNDPNSAIRQRFEKFMKKLDQKSLAHYRCAGGLDSPDRGGYGFDNKHCREMMNLLR